MVLRLLVVGILAIALSASTAWGLICDTSAKVWSGGVVQDSDSDSSTGATYAGCSSFASHTTGTWASGTASAQRTPTGADFDTDVDGNLGQVNDQYQATAGAGYGWGWGYIVGLGTEVLAQLAFPEVTLIVPEGPGNTVTIGSFCGVPETETVSGTATLSGDGVLAGNGYYIESFFDVFHDPGAGTWGATRDPAPVEVTLPVGTLFNIDSLFDVFTELSVEGGAAEVHSDHRVALVLPQGYELQVITPVPEPGTLALVALGALGLAMRRRA